MVDIVYPSQSSAPPPSSREEKSVLLPTEPQLSLRVACAKGTRTSFVAHQYATYPFRLSGNLRLAPDDSDSVYAYIMNAGPGVLSGDKLQMRIEVGDRASLYLTDQSATKVHSRPAGGAAAQVTWNLHIGAEAFCEFVPEPIILFNSAALMQKTQVTLHPQGRLVLSERIVPGRMARGEFYTFDSFQSRLSVQSLTGELYFADNLRLMGKSNQFKDNPLFSDLPILANFVVIVPGISLGQLAQALQQFEAPTNQLQVCESPLPGCHGLLVRAIAAQTNLLQRYQHHLLNCVRQLIGRSPLPLIPK